MAYGPVITGRALVARGEYLRATSVTTGTSAVARARADLASVRMRAELHDADARRSEVFELRRRDRLSTLA